MIPLHSLFRPKTRGFKKRLYNSRLGTPVTTTHCPNGERGMAPPHDHLRHSFSHIRVFNPSTQPPDHSLRGCPLDGARGWHSLYNQTHTHLDNSVVTLIHKELRTSLDLLFTHIRMSSFGIQLFMYILLEGGFLGTELYQKLWNLCLMNI